MKIRLTESELKDMVREAVHEAMCEYGYDEQGNAENDFYESGFEGALEEKYPGMEFDFEVGDDGTVKVTDLDSGDYYIGNGELEYDTVGQGYPSLNDYDTEAEGQEEHYDFYGCLKTIMQKIDNSQPDGNTNG